MQVSPESNCWQEIEQAGWKDQFCSVLGGVVCCCDASCCCSLQHVLQVQEAPSQQRVSVG